MNSISCFHLTSLNLKLLNICTCVFSTAPLVGVYNNNNNNNNNNNKEIARGVSNAEMDNAHA